MERDSVSAPSKGSPKDTTRSTRKTARKDEPHRSNGQFSECPGLADSFSTLGDSSRSSHLDFADSNFNHANDHAFLQLQFAILAKIQEDNAARKTQHHADSFTDTGCASTSGSAKDKEKIDSSVLDGDPMKECTVSSANQLSERESTPIPSPENLEKNLKNGSSPLCPISSKGIPGSEKTDVITLRPISRSEARRAAQLPEASSSRPAPSRRNLLNAIESTPKLRNVISYNQEEDRFVRLPSGIKVHLRGMKHVRKAIENGRAVTVKCAQCKIAYKLPESAEALLCQGCQQIYSIAKARQVISLTSDHKIASLAPPPGDIS